MKRVMVVGGPGAGKSTLAVELGRLTGLPVRHMDLIHWQSGWIERPQEEKDRLTREVHADDAWILEGGHSRTYDARAARSDTLIWLDLPLPLRLWRIWRRWRTWGGRTRSDPPAGCPEMLTPKFVRWIVTSRGRTRRRIARLIAEHPHLDVRHLRSRSEVARFLASVR